MFDKSKLLAVGLLAAVAVGGFAAGAATRSYAADERREPRPGHERWSYSGMLKDELGLTDAQRDSVRSIIRRHRPEMRAVYESVRPQLDSIRTQINTEINALLTADQQQRYAALSARMRAERAERMRADSAGRRD